MSAAQPRIGAHRRALQRGHLARLKSLLDDEAAGVSQSDVRAAARAQLKSIRADARSGASSADDEATQQHLDDVADWIDAALDMEG